MLVLTLGREFDAREELDDAETCGGLHFEEVRPAFDAPLWTASGAPGHGFFRQYQPPPRGFAERPVHPWVDHILRPDRAIELLDELLSRDLVLRVSTNCIVAIAHPRGTPAPLFMVPGDEGPFIGIGVFPAVPPPMTEMALAMMSAYSRRGCDLGGKRYLSGYVDWTREDWPRHFAGAWELVQASKRRLDPRGLLNPLAMSLG